MSNKTKKQDEVKFDLVGNEIAIAPKAGEAVSLVQERFVKRLADVRDKIGKLDDKRVAALAEKHAPELLKMQEAGALGVALTRGVMMKAADIINEWKEAHEALVDLPAKEGGKPVKTASFTKTVSAVFGAENQANYMRFAKAVRKLKTLNPAALSSGMGVRQILKAVSEVGGSITDKTPPPPRELGGYTEDEAYAAFRAALERLAEIVAECPKLKIADADRETLGDLVADAKKIATRKHVDEDEDADESGDVDEKE